MFVRVSTDCHTRSRVFDSLPRFFIYIKSSIPCKKANTYALLPSLFVLPSFSIFFQKNFEESDVETCILLVANSTPIVDFDSKLNSFRVNRDNKLDLPTPESPINTTVIANYYRCTYHENQTRNKFSHFILDKHNYFNLRHFSELRNLPFLCFCIFVHTQIKRLGPL